MKLLAADLGASGGKMILGDFDGSKLKISEPYSFQNKPCDIGMAIYWDFIYLYNSILDGIIYFKDKYSKVDTIGVDTWGASYGLVDEKGLLVEPLYHYRDRRTANIIEKLKKVISDETIFDKTGCQYNFTYTLPQLYEHLINKKDVLDRTSSFLLVPDLIKFFMTGIKSTEETIAGTTCLYDVDNNCWSNFIIDKLGLPTNIFTNINKTGSLVGKISQNVSDYVGYSDIKFVSSIEHDSASAVASIPRFGRRKLYISIGTAISMGVESDNCIITHEAFKKGIKNTGGFGNTKIIYRDFYACWYINEFLRYKKSCGVRYDFDDLKREFNKEIRAVSWFNPDNNIINYNENFFENMNNYFIKTGQRALLNDGEMIKSIYESIALNIRYYSDIFQEVTDGFDEVFIINGGTQNVELMQMISNSLNMEVKVGMIYSSAIGNILSQLYATRELKNLSEIRELSYNSFKLKKYQPNNINEKWDEKYNEFLEKVKK